MIESPNSFGGGHKLVKPEIPNQKPESNPNDRNPGF